MNKLILVTGSHRSGSTWVGGMISLAKNVRNIHEPFNPAMQYQQSPFKYWFEHLHINSDLTDQKKAKYFIRSFYSVFHPNNFNDAFKIHSVKSLHKFLTKIKSEITQRTLLKDPIAVMSAEWIYHNFHADIIVMIRHPAAFVASLKVKNWQFDFNNFFQQKELMNDYLFSYKDLIEEYVRSKKDIIRQGILLWNTIYNTVHFYREKYGNAWYFVRHEDLLNNTIDEFKKIFIFLNLNFTHEIESKIAESTQVKNEGYTGNKIKELLINWKSRLTQSEIDLVKEGTSQVWPQFYNDQDW
jgi:hypothetical protein